MKPLLIIVPTRNRPKNVKRFTEFYNKNTCGCSQVVLITDSADKNDYEYTGFIVERDDKPTTSPQKLNRMAKKYSDGIKVISYIGEDTTIETKDFDKKILDKMAGIKYCFLTPDDGYNKSLVPVSWFISIDLYKRMGYLAYPKIFHAFTDFIWWDITKLLGKRYIIAEDILMIHHHFINDPTVKPDATVKDIISHSDKDNKIYRKWQKNEYEQLKLEEL